MRKRKREKDKDTGEEGRIEQNRTERIERTTREMLRSKKLCTTLLLLLFQSV